MVSRFSGIYGTGKFLRSLDIFWILKIIGDLLEILGGGVNGETDKRTEGRTELVS